MDKLIFISHKESDVKIAEKLVEFLLAALDIEEEKVLCTSVPGHMLKFGPPVPEQLRDGLVTSAVLIGLLTQDSVGATWVIFELGAAWGLKKLVIPILGPGLKFSDIPGPLGNSPGVQINATNASSRLMDAVNQIASQLGLTQKTGGKAQAKLSDFVTAFASLPVAANQEKVPQLEQSEPTVSVLTLSEREKQMLLEAVQDANGAILHQKFMGGEAWLTHGKQFGGNIQDGESSSKEIAQWKAALDQLINKHLVEQQDHKAVVFRVTAIGYQVGENLVDG